MKIERVNENKIKVTVSSNDLEERNIDFGSLNYNSPAAQELFWDMMEQAEIQLGFKASDSQLCIEAIPDTNEGFVITITKIDEDGDFESIHKYIKGKYKNNDINVKNKPLKSVSNHVIYYFNDFDDICSLSKNLYSIYAGDSTLFRYKGIYYIILSKNKLLISSVTLFDSMLSEYGIKVQNPTFYEGLLCEYAEKIIESNAIETLNNYF